MMEKGSIKLEVSTILFTVLEGKSVILRITLCAFLTLAIGCSLGQVLANS